MKGASVKVKILTLLFLVAFLAVYIHPPACFSAGETAGQGNHDTALIENVMHFAEGKFAINPEYDDARSFSDKLAAVKSQGTWGYIDRKGALAIAPAYSTASDFSGEGIALVGKDGETFYIKTNGKRALDVSAHAKKTLASQSPSQGSSLPDRSAETGWSPRIAVEEKLAPHVRSAAPDDRWAPEIFDDANQQQ